MDDELKKILIIRLETIIDRKQETRLKAREIMTDIILKVVAYEQDKIKRLAMAKSGEPLA